MFDQPPRAPATFVSQALRPFERGAWRAPVWPLAIDRQRLVYFTVISCKDVKRRDEIANSLTGEDGSPASGCRFPSERSTDGRAS